MNPSTTASSANRSDVSTANVSHCRVCGYPLDAADAVCPDCGAPQDHASAPAAEKDAQPARAQIQCRGCGAELAVDPDQRSLTCPFCDGAVVLEFNARISDRQPPEFVIGFAVTPEAAVAAFQTWLKRNAWYRPSDLAQAKIAERLRGVYLPFWSFAVRADSTWRARIGEYWYRTETYTTVENGKTVTRTRTVQETEWHELAGRHHSYHSQYLVSASRGLPQKHADAVGPFRIEAMHRYAPRFLAGWASEEYALERDPAYQVCQAEFERREAAQIAAFLPGDTHSGLQVQTRFSLASSDLLLLPIYLVGFQYGKKTYRFAINGQTGKVYGEKPVSAGRIAAVVAVGILIIAGVVALAMFFGSR